MVSHDPGIARHVDRVVAIRDGKTAAETLRVSAGDAKEGAGRQEKDGGREEGVLEELAVLDSAGRLQIPKEYLELFEIGTRAKLEVAEDGILVRPVSDSARANDVSIPDMGLVSSSRQTRGLLNLAPVRALTKVVSAATSRLLPTLRRHVLMRRRTGEGDEDGGKHDSG
jgi:bifunctional DNA-binding transcriptional regulator/antitoxin component of YhaV-PrlF toxin-antitoxin module